MWTNMQLQMIMKITCIVLLLLCAMSSSTTALETYYMPSPCTDGKLWKIYLSTIYFGSRSSGILKLNSSRPGDDCGVVVKTHSADTVTISVEKLDVVSGSNKLTFTDGYTTGVIDRFYRMSRRAAYSSIRPGADVTIRYKADRNFNYKGEFKLVFTAFKNGTNCKSSSMFQCGNSRCISKDLACDGYNHCGDSSDLDCSTSVGAVAGYVVCGVILIVAFVCLVLIGIRQKGSMESVVRSTGAIHPPLLNYQQTGVVNPTYNTTGYQQLAYPAGYQQSSSPTDHHQLAYPAGYQQSACPTGHKQHTFSK